MAAPLQKQWADAVTKAGGNPDAIYKELQASIAKTAPATSRDLPAHRCGERAKPLQPRVHGAARRCRFAQ